MAVVGDIWTCKVNRSVMKKLNSTGFGWMTEILGDLHPKGHLCEAVLVKAGSLK